MKNRVELINRKDMKMEEEPMVAALIAELLAKRNAGEAENLKRFFKTGKGEYGEGDSFLGIKVPVVRAVVKPYLGRLSYADIENLLKSEWHEVRFAALVGLIYRYERCGEKGEAFDFYLSHTDGVNNWDLVDCSAHKIVGDYLKDKERNILFRLSESGSMWERRIAVVACYQLIRNGEFDEIKRLARQAMDDREELMHKAAGWMLREMGKVCREELDSYLTDYASVMPRVMLRYAIEKYPEEERKEWLKY